MVRSMRSSKADIRHPRIVSHPLLVTFQIDAFYSDAGIMPFNTNAYQLGDTQNALKFRTGGTPS